MKTTILKSALFVALTTGILSSCVKDDDYSTPELSGCTGTTLVKNREVSQILATSTVALHENIVPGVSDVIEAYVTSSDIAGNFFKSISFQTLDGSRAFSIPVDATNTFINYEPGRKVLIKMDGLYTDIKDGGMRIGSLYVDSSGAASVGRMSEADFRLAVQPSCEIKSEDVLVQKVSILDVQSDSYLNKLIEIDNIQFDDNAVGRTYYDPNNDIGGATNHYLTNVFGTKIVFRTSSYSNFASKSVSDKSGKVRGVLTKYGDTFQFLARSQKDIMLTSSRFALVPPFFQQDFQEAIDGTNLNITGWYNIATEGTKLWKEEVYQGNGYAEFSAFSSGSATNTCWLISPAINLSSYTTKQLEFEVAQHHLDVDSPNNSLEVLISTDFDGINVSTATWTPLQANLPVKATSWYVFLKSSINISNISGTNVHVAFKFKGSGTDTTLDGAFQVDNFKVFGN